MQFLGKALVLALCGGTLALLFCLKPARPLTTGVAANVSPGVAAERGRALFERNCAHCHGDDARGDEGPNLYNLTLSDARIANRIKNGIKSQMPKFGSKLTGADVKALIAFLRTLKN